MVTGYVTQREYQVALEQLVNGFIARTIVRPELQLYFYRQDDSGLKYALGDYLKSNAVRVAVAYSSIGEKLARRDAHTAASGQFPSLKTLRENLSVTDSGLIAIDSERKQSGTGFWSSLVASDDFKAIPQVS